MATDYSQGKVSRHIIGQALPLIVAELVHLLYNVVDRIYIGHMESGSSLALTGVGLTFPISTLILAFTALYRIGGTPMFSIARGERDEEKAERILGTVTAQLVAVGLGLTVFCYCLRRPILYLFGASDASYVYAEEYLRIYLLGTVFTMFVTGINGFINAQGFPKTGMVTTVIGAVLNIILDPIFIFALDMGVGGAALATVISQIVSALWVLRFLTGDRASLRIRRKYLVLDREFTPEILRRGTSGFITQATNCLVQILCNASLQVQGGDLYVGVMTVVNSVREIFMLPVNAINQGSQPVMGYNYGAKEMKRVKQSIRFDLYAGVAYAMVAWGVIIAFPKFWCGLFSSDPGVLLAGPKALHLYFFGFFFMAFMLVGQAVFQTLGYARHAIFFSVLRKVVIVCPLTLLLPRWGFGVWGVFLAEPISNALGGLVCFASMWRTVYRKLE